MPVDPFSPSDLCLIFFGTNALLRTCGPGATFGPDILALVLRVDWRNRCIMSHFIVAQRFAYERIFPIRREKYRALAHPIAKTGVSGRHIPTNPGYR